MSLPTAYTEATLAQYMHSELGPVASVLGYTAPNGNAGAYQEPVNEVVLTLGVSDLAEATDIRKVRALGRLEAWKLAINALSTKYDFNADGASYSRSQMHDQAKVSLERAQSDCLELGLLGNTAVVQSLDYQYDPYNFPKDLDAV